MLSHKTRLYVNSNLDLVSLQIFPFLPIFKSHFLGESIKPAVLLKTTARVLFQGSPVNLPIAAGAQNPTLRAGKDLSKRSKIPLFSAYLTKILKTSVFLQILILAIYLEMIQHTPLNEATDRFAGEPWKLKQQFARERPV